LPHHGEVVVKRKAINKTKSTKSGEVAKSRLENVMLQEHLDMSPQLVEIMKKDVTSTLQKYIQVKEPEVSFKWCRADEFDEKNGAIEISLRVSATAS